MCEKVVAPSIILVLFKINKKSLFAVNKNKKKSPPPATRFDTFTLYEK